MVHFRSLYKTRIIILAIVALSLLSSAASASQLSEKRKALKEVNARIERKKAEIKEVNRRRDDILNEIAVNDRVINKLQKEINELQKELRSCTASRRKTEDELFRMRQALKKAIKELAIAERKLAYKREIYDRRLSSIYKNSDSGMVEVVLGAKDLGDLVKRAALIQIIGENDARMVAELKETQQNMVTKLAQIEVQKKAINKQYLKLVDEENHLKVVRKRVALRQELFHKELKRQKAKMAVIMKSKKQLAKAEDMLESTSKMIAGHIRILERGGKLPSRGYRRASSGAMIRPVDARVTSPFGMRMHPVLGYRRMHTGVDFGGGAGRTIHAAQSGTVIMAGWMGGYGNTVVISHGGGVSTLYAHCSKLYVNNGESVSAGQPVAAVGSTGLSTGPHLHFEVRVNGNPQNPMNWL